LVCIATQPKLTLSWFDVVQMQFLGWPDLLFQATGTSFLPLVIDIDSI
jgi:hypothetical protein